MVHRFICEFLKKEYSCNCKKAILLGHLRKRLHNDFSSNWSSPSDTFSVHSSPNFKATERQFSIISLVDFFLPKMSTYLL